MGFEDELAELEQLVDVEVPKVEQEGWSEELGLWLAAWVFESFGVSALIPSGAICESVDPDTFEAVSEKLVDVFRPPTILVETPFQNAEVLWWEAVSRLLGEGKILDRSGKVCLPNYGAVLDLWAAGIEEEYGFRFTSTKLEDVERELAFHTRDAGRVMAAKRNGVEVSQESLRDAARVLAGRSVVSRRRSRDAEESPQECSEESESQHEDDDGDED